MTFERKAAIGFVVYLSGFWLTFGWHYNRPDPVCLYGNALICQTNNEMGAVLKGVFWPGYWTGRLAIEVTKP